MRSSGAIREVVGVVGNVQQRGGFQSYGPIDALPGYLRAVLAVPSGGLRTIHGWFSTAWIIRQTHDGAVTEPALRRAMAEIDPQLRGVGGSRCRRSPQRRRCRGSAC